jgi:hypothetical protein
MEMICVLSNSRRPSSPPPAPMPVGLIPPNGISAFGRRHSFMPTAPASMEGVTARPSVGMRSYTDSENRPGSRAGLGDSRRSAADRQRGRSKTISSDERPRRNGFPTAGDRTWAVEAREGLDLVRDYGQMRHCCKQQSILVANILSMFCLLAGGLTPARASSFLLRCFSPVHPIIHHEVFPRSSLPVQRARLALTALFSVVTGVAPTA